MSPSRNGHADIVFSTGSLPDPEVSATDEIVRTMPHQPDEIATWLNMLTITQFDRAWITVATIVYTEGWSPSSMQILYQSVRQRYRDTATRTHSSVSMLSSAYTQAVESLYESGRKHVHKVEQAYLDSNNDPVSLQEVFTSKDIRNSAARCLRRVPGWVVCDGAMIARKKRCLFARFNGDLEHILNTMRSTNEQLDTKGTNDAAA